MDYTHVRQSLNILNEYLANNIPADSVAAALRVLSNLASETGDEDSAKLLIEFILWNEIGLFNFIKELRKRSSIDSEIVSATFDLLDILLFDFNICVPYYDSVFDLLNTCISWAKNLEMRINSYTLLKKLVENEDSQSIPDFLIKSKSLFDDLLVKTESVTFSTEKRITYQLMGSLIERLPHVLNNIKDQRKVLRKLENDIASLINKDKGITELEGVLICLNSFLLHFFDTLDEPTVASLYSSIKQICEEAKSRRISAREGLKVIGRQFDLFSEKVFYDYSWWHAVMREYLRSPNKDDSVVAYEVSGFFYPKMAELLQNKSTQISGPILDFYTFELKKFLSSSEKREVSVALKNIGYFAVTCKSHGKLFIIQELFRQMAEIVEKLSLGFEDEIIEQHLFADMLVSLTKIAKNLESEFSNEEEFSILIKLGRYVIISYPRVPSPFQSNVIRALVRTFIQIASVSEQLLISYLDQVFFVCLIRTCSHLTEDDATLLHELGASDREIFSYKNYVPLWRDLCNLHNVNYLQTLPECEKVEFGRHKVDQRILDSVIDSVLKILEKLDLSISENEIVQEPLHNFDNLFEAKVKNESDYIILNNLIELFVAVVEDCEFDMLDRWIPLLIKTFVKFARDKPIKSGFFYLLTAVFKKSGSSFHFEQHLDLNDMLRVFFVDVLVRVDEFYGPELITCLRMMMNAPIPIIKGVILSRINILFEATFTLGRDDISLAHEGLKCLENFYSEIPLEDFEFVLYFVVPYLGFYLETNYFIGETDSLSKHEEDFLASSPRKSKDNVFKKYYKYIGLVNNDLAVLQEHIVKFLSTIDAKYCTSLYTLRINTFTESFNYLKFYIPFGDMKVHVFLDKFLPRTMEIACNSSDLKTRIVACEFFHSIITIFIANSNFTFTYPKEIRQLFNNLISCSLRLGCDTNGIVKQMFYPLCAQIVRFYASRPLTESPGTKLLLNILFNGTSNRSDNTLRYLCAKLIRVFVQWSLKRTKIDIRHHRVPVNVEAVVKKICFFCELPSSHNKLGAALVIIKLYSTLKDDPSILNEFWAEILLSFVKNLHSSSKNECNNEASREALRCIGRILRENSETFVKENDRRKLLQPSKNGIGEVMLKIFQYSTSQNIHCRCACMDLTFDLCRIANCESLKSFFANLDDAKLTILDSFLGCLHLNLDMAVFEIDTTVDKLEKLHAYLQLLISGLHCLNWFLNEEIIIFNSAINVDSRFWISLKFFCEKIVLHNFNIYASYFVHAPAKKNVLISDFAFLRDQIFLQYLKIISFSGNQFDAFIGNEPFQINLWNHFVNCLFGDLGMTDKVINNNSSEPTTSIFLSVLRVLKNCASSKINSVLEQINCSLNSSKLWKTLGNFKNDSDLTACLNIQSHLFGAILLQDADFLSSIVKDIDSLSKRIYINIFEIVNTDHINVAYTERVISFLENVLSLCLPNVEEEVVYNFIFDENQVIHLHQTLEMTRGRHFFTTFKTLFATYTSQHQEFLVSRNVFSLNKLTKQKIQMILDCLIYQLDFDELLRAIYKEWFVLGLLDERNTTLEFYFFDFIRQTCEKFINCENFTSELQSNVRQWLLERLEDSKSPVLIKEKIIRLLPSFVTRREDISDFEMFRLVVKKLRSQYLDLTGRCILSETEFILIFNSLLFLLRESRNASVLNLVISFRAFDSTSICDEEIENSLLVLMRQQSSNHQLQVIDVVYNIFQNENSDFNQNFTVDIVDLFLVPLLQMSKFETVIKFYCNKFHWLMESLKYSAQNYSSSEKEQIEITKQICAIRLIETYCNCVADLDCPEVTLVLYPNGESTLRKDLTKLLRSLVLRNATLNDTTNGSSFRQMKCFAYNALIGIIKKIQKEEKFYNLLFMESDRTGYIWKHLVDHHREMNLSMVPEEILTRKKNFRRKKMKKTDAIHSLPSQYFSTSSLVDSIVKFDLSGWNQIDSSYENVSYSSRTIDLEEEILNKHECMVSLCDLLKFLVENNISPLPNMENEINPEMRPWMTCLHASLKYYLKEKSRNIIMFLIRLVYNCEDIFLPYGSSWIDLIIRCLIFLNDFNYFTSDVITMFTFTWRNRTFPRSELANDLLKLLLSKIDGNSTVRNYQIDLIGALVDSWHSVLDCKLTLLQSHLKVENVKEINLRIAKRFLLHSVLPFDRENKAEYLQNLFQLAKSSFGKRITELTFEILALILRTGKCDIANTCMNPTECVELENHLTDCLTWLRTNNATKKELFFSCLDHVVVYYPEIVNRFSSYLLTSFKKLQGIFKIKCLKILANTKSDNSDDLFLLLIRPELINCLQTNDYDLQKQALAVLNLAVSKFEDEDVNKFLPVLSKLSSHSSSECRSATYDIFNCILSNYNDRCGDECEKIKLHCKTILLNGLLDCDDLLRQKMFNSWKLRLNLNEIVAARFMSIIRDMYSPLNESQFVSYAVDFLLEASSLVSDFESCIFDNPLMGNDEFQEYHILTSSGVTRSILPEFPTSISHRMKTLTQNSNFSSSSLHLYGPQSDFIFQPNLYHSASLKKETDSLGCTVAGAAYSAHPSCTNKQQEKNRLRRRLFANVGEASEHFASVHIKHKSRQKALAKQKHENVNRKITLCRKYRIGNFPDIQIPRSAIIIPMRMLAKRDVTFARIVLVHIVEEILSKIPEKKDNLLHIDNVLNNMLKSSCKHDRVFIETLFEIAFNHFNEISLDSNIVAAASYSSGLFSLGALLLENAVQKIDLRKEDHVPKKLKSDHNLHDNWTQLAELYSALNEFDLVNGILQEKVLSNTSSILKEGMIQEQAANLPSAKKIYEMGLKYFADRITRSYDERFISEAFFKCASNLSLWDEINTYVRNQFKDLDLLWEDIWDVEHTLPWFFTSEAYLCGERSQKSNLFASVISSWLENKDKASLLSNLVAEQMAVILVNENKTSEASVIVKDCIKFLINDWNCSKISLNQFQRLQILFEINTMLAILKDSNAEHIEVEISQLIKTWEHDDSKKASISFWDRRIMNRILFSRKFMDLPIDEKLGEHLQHARIILKLVVLESAVDQENNYVAQKYFQSLIKKNSELRIPDKFAHRFWLNRSKVFLLNAKHKEDHEKVEQFFHCLDSLENGRMNLDFDYFAHLATVMSAICETSNIFFNNEVTKKQLISRLERILKKTNLSGENFLREMSVSGVLENYEKSAEFALSRNRSYNEVSLTYLTMAKFCKEFINKGSQSLIYEEHMIRSLLRAMKFDSKESQILFPTLLHLSHIKDNSLKEVFLLESNKIEEWKYLPWIQQLLAYVGTDFVTLVEHILKKIIDRYPNSVQLTFYASVKNINCPCLNSRKLIDELQRKVDPDLKIVRLLEAFSHIRTPGSFFDYWWNNLWKITKENNFSEALIRFEETFCQTMISTGELFTNHPVLKTFKECIGILKMNGENTNVIEANLKTLKIRISESENSDLSDRHQFLELFSPACVQFVHQFGENIEIPGQYIGFSVPVPEKHVKIYNFHERVMVQNSKQKPIKIKIIGNDAKKYNYLVKFEDDIRQDQRIQQIFGLINQCASSLDDANSKSLGVITYGVYPLDPDFGIIEWVQNTTTLKDFMDYGLPQNEKLTRIQKRADLLGQYHIGLREKFAGSFSIPDVEVYEEAVKKFDRNLVVSLFQRCSREIPETVFRDSLLALCRSPNVFWNVRNTFMRSYSIMCIYGWILGIGDRHLKNTLVCLKTGNCVGIDFGYAFETSVECTRVPELIPFRMTPHLKSIMAPMYLTGLIRETMVKTLKKFKESEYVLLAALQIFILEPAFNWLNLAKKRMQEQNENNEQDLRWYPAQKIDTIVRKLNGINPAIILTEAIRKNQVIKAQYKTACIKLIMERNCSIEDQLIISAQVDRLLDLATDEGILGISWYGLETYI